MSEPTYLKVLSKTGQACHGGEFDYSPHLPSENGPGLELPQRKPALCKSGWHWCSPDSLMRNWAVAGMQVYEAEPSADVTAFDNAGKCVSSSGRLVRPYALPQWWIDAMQFVAEDIPKTPWCTCQGKPSPEWKLFLADEWDAARVAAGAAARAAAGDAAWDAARAAAGAAAVDAARAAARAAAGDVARDAAWAAAAAAAGDAARAAAWAAAGAAAGDAALYTRAVHICDDVDLDIATVEHARARWDVWQRGYGLLCDVDGVLFCYGVRS